MSAAILIWTDRARHPLADALMRAGFLVWEALAISEVLAICDSKNIDVVVIAAAVDESRCPGLKQHHLTIKLKPNTKTGDLIQTLWQMFPDKKTTVQ
jgi:hypothetical protein